MFLNAYPIIALFSPKVLSAESNETIIALQNPNDKAVAELQKSYPDVRYLALACFQKLYKDQFSNFAKGLVLKGPYGQTMLSLNNIGALGPDLVANQRVNLFVGASETFECSLTPIDQTGSVPDWVAMAEVPFNEMGANINGAIEGAHFPLIIRRTARLRETIVERNAILENLFVYGGWHNLIYNDNTPDAWQRYCDELVEMAPRVSFFQITSPVLNFSFEEIKAFCEKGYPFWGYLECSEENFRSLRGKIIQFNEWLEQYCAERPNALFIPIHRFLQYSAEEIPIYFRDVNHFSRTTQLRQALVDGLNDFLMQNAEMFSPQLGSVSEYIYPTF